MSEENLEALHKIVRRIRERKARLINVGMNLTDILTRWVFIIESRDVCPYIKVVLEAPPHRTRVG